jgi:hypothetical protein
VGGEHCPEGSGSDRSLWASAVLIVCTLEFEIVSFENIRRIPPFIDVRLDELHGVLESQVSSREENLIVARSAQRACRNSVKCIALVCCLFCIRAGTDVCTADPNYKIPRWEDSFASWKVSRLRRLDVDVKQQMELE